MAIIFSTGFASTPDGIVYADIIAPPQSSISSGLVYRPVSGDVYAPQYSSQVNAYRSVFGTSDAVSPSHASYGGQSIIISKGFVAEDRPKKTIVCVQFIVAVENNVTVIWPRDIGPC